jgi:hypothetical protein
MAEWPSLSSTRRLMCLESRGGRILRQLCREALIVKPISGNGPYAVGGRWAHQPGTQSVVPNSTGDLQGSRAQGRTDGRTTVG